MNFSKFFVSCTGCSPYKWQEEIGNCDLCNNRLIQIPTGFGKTSGTVLTWLYHRVQNQDLSWPTRLVICLPMRVLVEQTEANCRKWLEKSELTEQVNITVLLGGSLERDLKWANSPHKPAILIGTQDMLLSRALNRGYSAHRSWWPVDFGLLNSDVLWIFDEIQLMDVGLATSAQLAAFRMADESRNPIARPAVCWWMSATLQQDWLSTIDFKDLVPELAQAKLTLSEEDQASDLWQIQKTVERRENLAITVNSRKKQKQGEEEESAEQETAEDESSSQDDSKSPAASKDAPKLAKEILKAHESGSLTLVVVNTVQKARELFAALRDQNKSKVDLLLLHSQFRGAERAKIFAHAISALPSAGRILVATQVIEAGVDLSAKMLWTELAPWPSLVQRFGRLARYAGESGQAVVFGKVPKKESEALPYSDVECRAAHEALTQLTSKNLDVSLAGLSQLESELDEKILKELYPYEPFHVLRRCDLESLFDTAADLSGSDLDVSRYIRSGDERDVRVLWRDLSAFKPEKSSSAEKGAVREDGASDDAEAEGSHRVLSIPAEKLAQIQHAELCPVPINALVDWLLKKHSAYRLDYRDKEWIPLQYRQVVPGMTVLIDATEGGYDLEHGWTGAKASSKESLDISSECAATLNESFKKKDDEWQSIGAHDQMVADQVCSILEPFKAPKNLSRVMSIAAHLHDWGKSHEAFQAKIKLDNRPSDWADAKDVAKAPDDQWAKGAERKRTGFRHEFASAMAIFEMVRRANPKHEALAEPYRELFETMGEKIPDVSAMESLSGIASELVNLDPDDLNLVAYLVCAHHGKVRCSLSATEEDQESPSEQIYGVCETDSLPKISRDGLELPAMSLCLDLATMGLSTRYGASWAERVSGLRKKYGPFGLAFLESLLRAADRVASGAEA